MKVNDTATFPGKRLNVRRMAETILCNVIGDYEPQPNMPKCEQAVLYNHELMRKAFTVASLAFPFAYRFIPEMRELPEIPVYISSAVAYAFFRTMGSECVCGVNKMRKRDRRNYSYRDTDGNPEG